MAQLEREPTFSVGHFRIFMLIQYLENIDEGLLHACISSIAMFVVVIVTRILMLHVYNLPLHVNPSPL
jgi:hypothetical protein